MTNGNDPITQTIFRQTGKDSYRPATEKEIKEGIYLVHKEGLTKREYFAAMAMQGLLSNYFEHGMYGNSPSYPMVEESAVKCADQLISELNKPNQS